MGACGRSTSKTENQFEAILNGSGPVHLTTNHERALREDGVALLGLEQPFVPGTRECPSASGLTIKERKAATGRQIP